MAVDDPLGTKVSTLWWENGERPELREGVCRGGVGWAWKVVQSTLKYSELPLLSQILGNR
jgi:hypothetical protein